MAFDCVFSMCFIFVFPWHLLPHCFHLFGFSFPGTPESLLNSPSLPIPGMLNWWRDDWTAIYSIARIFVWIRDFVVLSLASPIIVRIMITGGVVREPCGGVRWCTAAQGPRPTPTVYHRVSGYDMGVVSDLYAQMPSFSVFLWYSFFFLLRCSGSFGYH